MSESFDYVIAGGGTAGCVLANRLSADAGVTVALIEAGPPDDDPAIHVPAMVAKAIGNPRQSWGYQTVPQRARRQSGAAGAARPRARRLFVDQRHGVFPRPSARIR